MFSLSVCALLAELDQVCRSLAAAAASSALHAFLSRTVSLIPALVTCLSVFAPWLRPFSFCLQSFLVQLLPPSHSPDQPEPALDLHNSSLCSDPQSLWAACPPASPGFAPRFKAPPKTKRPLNYLLTLFGNNLFCTFWSLGLLL